MKLSKQSGLSIMKWAAVAIVALLGVLKLTFGVGTILDRAKTHSFGSDLNLRYNEILCAHQGVNSFRIWNRDTTLSGFVPLERPDKPSVVPAKSDKIVHSYTPWHTTMFYFMGWLSDWECKFFVACLLVLCFGFAIIEGTRIARERCDSYLLVSGFAFAMILGNAMDGFYFLNYGLLLLGAYFLMYKALEKNHPILAGIAWAVMMIKPQVGLLFVWPLFWRRKYLSIITAVIVCIGAALCTSVLVHDSVVDLISQILLMGKPYQEFFAFGKILKPVLGEYANLGWLALCFMGVGVMTYMLQKKGSDFLACCVPSVAAIPIWTYSQPHDRVILFIFFLAIGIRIFNVRKLDKWVLAGVLFCVLEIFLRLWSINVLFGVAQKGSVYNLAYTLVQLMIFVLLAMFVWDEYMRPRSNPTQFCHQGGIERVAKDIAAC